MKETDPDMHQIQNNLKELLEKSLSKDQIKRFKDLVSSFLLEISSNGNDNAINSKEYLQFIKLLEENYTRFYCIKEYSQLLKISARKLNKIVKNNSGKTTCELVSKKMISEAKEMLTKSDLSVKEIAFHLGFDDQYYFSRYFKKYTGISPRNYKVSSASMSI